MVLVADGIERDDHTMSAQQFGRALREWLHDPAPRGGWSWVRGAWTEGSCHPLAVTIDRWLQGRGQLITVVTYGAPDVPQHVAVRLPDGWIIDGDGATRDAAFFRRWQRIVDEFHAHLPADDRTIEVVPYNDLHAEMAVVHDLCFESRSLARFYGHFSAAFGAPSTWGL